MKRQIMHPLAEQYLAELRRLTSGMSRSARAELLDDVRAHLQAGLAEAHGDADVRNLLEALGSPASVVGAAEWEPPTARERWTPLLYVALAVLCGVFEMMIGWTIGTVFALAGILHGIRVTRRLGGISRASLPAAAAVVLGAAFTAMILSYWTIFIPRRIGIPETGPVNVSASPAVAARAVGFQLRPVLTAHALAGRDCTVSSSLAENLSEQIQACSADKRTEYLLGPAAVTGDQVTQVSASSTGSALQTNISVTFDDAGASALQTMSQTLSKQSAPQSSMAVLLRGEVQSTPMFVEPVTGNVAIFVVPLSKVQAMVLIDGIMGTN